MLLGHERGLHRAARFEFVAGEDLVLEFEQENEQQEQHAEQMAVGGVSVARADFDEAQHQADQQQDAPHGRQVQVHCPEQPEGDDEDLLDRVHAAQLLAALFGHEELDDFLPIPLEILHEVLLPEIRLQGFAEARLVLACLFLLFTHAVPSRYENFLYGDGGELLPWDECQMADGSLQIPASCLRALPASGGAAPGASCLLPPASCLLPPASCVLTPVCGRRGAAVRVR